MSASVLDALAAPGFAGAGRTKDEPTHARRPRVPRVHGDQRVLLADDGRDLQRVPHPATGPRSVPVGAVGDRLGGLVPPVRNTHRCGGRHHQPADLDRHRSGRGRRRVPAPRALAQLLDGGCLATDLGDLRDVRERRRRRVAHGRGRGGGRSTAVPPRRPVLACGSVGRDRRGRGARDREPRSADPRGRRRPAGCSPRRCGS